MDKDTEVRLLIGVREWAIEKVLAYMGVFTKTTTKDAETLEKYVTKGLID